MRITPNITSQNSLYNIQQSRALLDRIQEKIASGQNYNRPSDDPVSARLLVGLGDQLRESDQYASNMQKAKVWLNVTNVALTGMATTMGEIKKLVSGSVNGTDDLMVRQNTVSQLQTFKQQLVDYGNTQVNNQYVLAGTDNQTPPFSGSTYSGNEGVINIEMSASTTQAMNLTGGQVLMGNPPNQYGSTNILEEIDNLIAAVTANDVTAIRLGAERMEDGAAQVNNAITDLGGRLKRIDTLKSLADTTKSMIMGVVADVQNVDYAKLAIEMNQQQIAFEATLSSTSKISQISLLDYL